MKSLVVIIICIVLRNHLHVVIIEGAFAFFNLQQGIFKFIFTIIFIILDNYKESFKSSQ